MAGTSLRVLPFERWPGRRVMFWRTHNIGVTRFAITTIWSGDSIAGIAWLVRIGAGAAAGAIHTGMAMAPQALRRMLPVLRQPGHRLPGLQFPVLFTGPAQRSAEAGVFATDESSAGNALVQLAQLVAARPPHRLLLALQPRLRRIAVVAGSC